MTNMLPRERAELIMAEHAAGQSIRGIAAAYGHSTQTVRDYVLGRRTPGEPAARDDDFGLFAAYCRRRLADEPHLRAAALLAEITGLGFPGTTRTFYRAMERHEIQPNPCPRCHLARISGYVLQPPARQPQPFPLPVPGSPVNGETLASFLSRLATANRTSLDALLDILPSWFRIKTRWHDDRWQHEQLTVWADDAAACLAVVSGSTIAAVKNALPAFGAKRGQPVRAVTACRLCTTALRIRQPVPVHLPAHHQVCLRHGIWLSGPGTPQFSVTDCPDILEAERRARRLLRRCTAEQLIYSTIQTPAGKTDREWKRRTTALIESNPRPVTESGPQELFQAAAYPDAIAAVCASRKARPKQSLLAEAAAAAISNGHNGRDDSRGLTIRIPLPRSRACIEESSLSPDRGFSGSGTQRGGIALLIWRRAGIARDSRSPPGRCISYPQSASAVIAAWHRRSARAASSTSTCAGSRQSHSRPSSPAVTLTSRRTVDPPARPVRGNPYAAAGRRPCGRRAARP